jgi:glycosyltransferase involved in cell wall biosynthesis
MFALLACDATVADPAPLRVQGATAYPLSAASARVRIANYAPFLAEHGINLRYESTLSAEEYALLSSSASPVSKALVLGRSALRAVRLPDKDALLLIHRLLTLTPLPLFDPPHGLDVYDFDDALLVGSAAESNRRFQWTKQEGRRAAACMRSARLVLTGNHTLAAQALPYANRVEVIPSCVDPSIQPMHLHEDTEEALVGWIGSHTTVGYLRPLLPVIERLNTRSRRVKLVVVGGDTGVRADWIEHRPWSLQTQALDIASFDVGVMPLPDDDWTQGKSGYKLLQYFAAGVPAVASPVGVNTEFVADGRGLAATTDADWQLALTELLDDATARAASGQRARRFVEERYSYQRWAPELAGLLHSLN